MIGRSRQADRIDDLAAVVRTLAPLATTVGVHGAKLEELDRDLGEKLDGHANVIAGRLDALVVQTTATNGRLRAVERWVAFAQGAVALAATAGAAGFAVKFLFS